MLAGTLEIQMLANMARLQADMNSAKSMVGGAMQYVESAVASAKTAFVGLGAGLTVGAFAAMVKGTIDATAGLHDMAIQTGASVAALSAFRSVAATTDTTLDGITSAMNRMAKAMAGADEDSKNVGAAVKALGLDFNQLKGMKPEDQMLAVADAMNRFEDGTGKSAVAMALYGKEGAKMLPFLKDLAEDIDSVKEKMTDQEIEAKRTQAAMADDYGDNLTKMKKASEGWKKDIAMAMLPALWEVSQAWRDVTEGPGGVKAEIGKLAADGTITEWTRTTISAITYVMDGFAGLKAVVVTVGQAIGFMAATQMLQLDGLGQIVSSLIHGDFEGASQAFKNTTAAQKQMTEDFHATLDKTWGEETLGSKLRARLEDLRQVGYAGKQAKESLNFDASSGDAAAAKEAARLREEQAKLMAELSGLSSSFTKDWQNLNILFSRGELSLEGLVDAQAKLLAKQPAIKDGFEAEMKAVKAAAEARSTARQKEEDGLKKYFEEQEEGYNKAVKGSHDALKAAQEQYDQYGMSKAQIAEITLLTLQSDQAKLREGSDGHAALQLQIEDQKKIIGLLKATEGLDAQKSMWSSIESTAHQTFTNIFQGGQDAFTKLRDTLKATVLDLLYQMTVKKWIVSIAASVSGAGVANAAIPGVSGSGILDMLGKLGTGGEGILSTVLSGMGAFGGGFGAGLGAVFGESGTLGALSAGTTAIGAGNVLGGLGTLAGAAAPWIAGAMALKALTDYKITPDGGGLTASLTSSGTTTGKVGSFQQFQQSSSGILSGGNTTNRSWTEADASTTAYLINSVKANTEIGKEYARMLGLNADALDGFTKDIEINTSGMDAAAAKAAIDAELTKFATEQVAAAYGDAVKQFALDGETALDTIKRLASIQVMSAQLNEFGGIFSKIATASVEARQSLIGMAGGIDALIKKSSNFVNDYYDANEKSGMSAKAILDQLKAVGLDNASTLQTKDDLRKLVETMDVSSEQGRKQLNALLDVAPQFSQIADVIKTQGGDLGTLAMLAPHIASLDTLFSDTNKTNDTESVVAAQETTTESIKETTDAVKDSTTAVVSAIDKLNATMAAVVTRLDGIENNGRLANAGMSFGVGAG